MKKCYIATLCYWKEVFISQPPYLDETTLDLCRTVVKEHFFTSKFAEQLWFSAGQSRNYIILCRYFWFFAAKNQVLAAKNRVFAAKPVTFGKTGSLLYWRVVTEPVWALQELSDLFASVKELEHESLIGKDSVFPEPAVSCVICWGAIVSKRS